jgi:hypothetical protein
MMVLRIFASTAACPGMQSKLLLACFYLLGMGVVCNWVALLQCQDYLGPLFMVGYSTACRTHHSNTPLFLIMVQLDVFTPTCSADALPQSSQGHKLPLVTALFCSAPLHAQTAIVQHHSCTVPLLLLPLLPLPPLLQAYSPSRVLTAAYAALDLLAQSLLFFFGHKLWANKRSRMLVGYAACTAVTAALPLVRLYACTDAAAAANAVQPSSQTAVAVVAGLAWQEAPAINFHPKVWG